MAGPRPLWDRKLLGDTEAWLAQRQADLARLASSFSATGPSRAGWKAPSVATRQVPKTSEFPRTITLEQIKAKVASATDMINRSRAAREAALVAGEVAGIPAGVVRGGWHTVDAAVATGRFALASNQEKAAGLSAVADAGSELIDYASTAAAHPDILKRDALSLLQKTNQSLNPGASPAADTATDEFQRVFDVAMNQGETAFDVGTTVFGGAPRVGLFALSKASEPARIAKYVKQGFTEAQAVRLAQPYRGVGHHSVIAQGRKNRRLEILKTLDIPRPILDSRFNVLRGRNMDTGSFYALHHALDKDGFRGTGFGEKIGGVWRAKDIPNLKEYGRLGRIWFGTPEATRIAIGATGLGGILDNFVEDAEER